MQRSLYYKKSIFYLIDFMKLQHIIRPTSSCIVIKLRTFIELTSYVSLNEHLNGVQIISKPRETDTVLSTNGKQGLCMYNVKYSSVTHIYKDVPIQIQREVLF